MLRRVLDHRRDWRIGLGPVILAWDRSLDESRAPFVIRFRPAPKSYFLAADSALAEWDVAMQGNIVPAHALGVESAPFFDLRLGWPRAPARHAISKAILSRRGIYGI